MTPFEPEALVAAPPTILAIAAIVCLILDAPGLSRNDRNRRVMSRAGEALALAAVLLAGAILVARGPSLRQTVWTAWTAALEVGPRGNAVGVAMLAALVPAVTARTTRRSLRGMDGARRAGLLLLGASLLVATEAASLPVLFVSIEVASLAAFATHAASRRRGGSVTAHELLAGATGSGALALGIALVGGASGELRTIDLRRLFLEIEPPVDRALLAAGVGLVSLAVAWKLIVLPLWTSHVDAAASVETFAIVSAARVGGLVVILRLSELLGSLGEPGARSLQIGLPAILASTFLLPGMVGTFRMRSRGAFLRAVLSVQTGTAFLMLLVLDRSTALGDADTDAGKVLVTLAITDVLGILAVSSFLAGAERGNRRVSAFPSLSEGCAVLGVASMLGFPFLAGGFAKMGALGDLTRSGHAAWAVLAGAATLLLARAGIRWSSAALRSCPEGTARIERLAPTELVSALAALALLVAGWLG